MKYLSKVYIWIQRGKQKWMTKQILALMAQGRKQNNKYKEMHKKITKLIKEVKES